MRTTKLLTLSVLAAGVSAACSSDPWNDPAIGDPYVPEPRLARPVGRLLEDASPRLVAATGGASLRAGDRTVWLLSDVRIGFGANVIARESAVLSGPLTDWAGSDGAVLDARFDAAAAQPPEGLDRRWLSGIAVGDDVVLHYADTRRGAEHEPSLDYHGAGVARLSAAGLRIATRGDGDERFFGRGDPLFGMAVLQADHGITTGFDYTFGMRGDAGTHRIYVARVPHGRDDERDAYRFYADAPEWSDDARDATPLFRAGPQGLSVSWNAHLQAFLAVYAWPLPARAGEPARIRVLARAARRPEGPWSRETALFETRGVLAPGRVRPDAGAREHAHLSRDDGRVLFVTVDGGDGAPRMWRVEWPEKR